MFVILEHLLYTKINKEQGEIQRLFIGFDQWTTLHFTETPFNIFSNSVEPDQTALIRAA